MDVGEVSSNSRNSRTSVGDREEIVEQTLDGDDEQTLKDANQRVQAESNVSNEGDPKKFKDMVCEGMVFESEEKAFDRYNEFAQKMGFVVRRDKLVKRADGTMRKRVFVCFKQGLRKKDHRYQYVRKERPQVRTNCMARMVIKYEKENKWVVTSIVYEHNHLLASPSNSYTSRSKRRMEGIPDTETKSFSVVGSVQADGLDYMSQHVEMRDNAGTTQNHLRDKRKEELGKGDVYALSDYFTRKQSENPSFFYSMIVDKESQLANLFWADARSIMDYNYFGDVVIFDTTYLTNKNGWPFAPFIGVNHHKQIVLFGGAFILDETIESFVWLFERWMKAMSGHKPKTILTDQCEAIAKAISIVMPETHHRLCLWNIIRDGADHLSNVYGMPGFLHDFKKCIYAHDTEEEFLSGWEKMLHEYNLVGNKWLDDLFKVRETWALVYDREIFCADMTSAQHGKTIHKFLKKFVKKKHSFVEFIARYEREVDFLRERELHEDFHSIHTSPNVFFPAPMLKQAADKYTRSVFEMFADEYKEWILCKVEDCGADGTIYKYEVTQEKHAKGLVTVDSSNWQAVCSCKKFDFVGILCRHIIKVLYHRNIHDLPSQYILKRWTKDAKSGVVKDKSGNPVQSDSKAHSLLRYNELCRKSINIATKGALNEELYLVAKRALANALLEVESAINATTKATKGALQTTPQVNIGERMIVAQGSDSSQPSSVILNGVEGGQRKKSRTSNFYSNNETSGNLSQVGMGKEGQSNGVSIGEKSNEPSIHLSCPPIVSMPSSTPIQSTLGISESMHLFYPVVSPNYIPTQNSQGSCVSGFEGNPFINHNTTEVSYISSKPQFLVGIHPQLPAMNTAFKSNQVSFNHGESRFPTYMHPQPPSTNPRFESNQASLTHNALQPSTHMDLQPTPGTIGFESSEESSDSDELQFSLPRN